MDAPLRFSLGHALHAVAARLEFQPGIGALADKAGDDFLVAADLREALGNDFDLPALALCVTRVHAKEVAREERRLVAARAGAHLDEHIAIVVRILRQKRLLQLRLQAFHAGPRALQLLVERQFPRGLGVAFGLAILLIETDHGREIGVLARLIAKAVHVARRVLGGEQALEIGAPRHEAIQLGPDCGLHPILNRRATMSASARCSAPAASFSACVGACISLLTRPCESASSTFAGSSPRASIRRARSSSSRRASSARPRNARISGTLSRTCIQCMNWPTWVSMITSAWATAERR